MTPRERSSLVAARLCALIAAAPIAARAQDAQQAPEPEAATDAASPPDEIETHAADKVAMSSWATRQRTAALERMLRSAKQEERDSTSWVPWAMTGTGVAAVAIGLLAGAIPTATCDDSCQRPFWTAWVLVGGAALTTAGSIWLVIDHGEEAELRYRRLRLEQQLEHERWNLQPVSRLSLSWSGRL